MSQHLRFYSDNYNKLSVTAFVGPEDDRICVQFTIGCRDYSQLNSDKMRKLIHFIETMEEGDLLKFDSVFLGYPIEFHFSNNMLNIKIENSLIQLTKFQYLDLVNVLQKRLDLIWTATGDEVELMCMLPNGELVDEEE